MDIECWKCGKQGIDLPSRISFREICHFCHSYLHCCKNCVNYQEGKANHCKIPGTEAISDREGRNTCEEFIILGNGFQKKEDTGEAFKRLFKED